MTNCPFYPSITVCSVRYCDQEWRRLSPSFWAPPASPGNSIVHVRLTSPLLCMHLQWYKCNYFGVIPGQLWRAWWAKWCLMFTAVVQVATKRRQISASSWKLLTPSLDFSAQLRGFRLCFVHMLKFEHATSLFTCHDLLFGGAKDVSVIFFVFVSLWAGWEEKRGRQVVVALSTGKKKPRGWELVYFLHIFWLIVPISLSQWTEVTGHFKNKVDHSFKGKVHRGREPIVSDLQKWIRRTEISFKPQTQTLSSHSIMTVKGFASVIAVTPLVTVCATAPRHLKMILLLWSVAACCETTQKEHGCKFHSTVGFPFSQWSVFLTRCLPPQTVSVWFPLPLLN